MAFVRKQVNNESTFETDGVTELISNPSFSIWNNTTSATTFDWNLGGDWTLVIDQTTDQLSYKFKNNPILTLSSSGYDLGSVSPFNFTSAPDANAYSVGTMVRINNELYVNVT